MGFSVVRMILVVLNSCGLQYPQLLFDSGLSSIIDLKSLPLAGLPYRRKVQSQGRSEQRFGRHLRLGFRCFGLISLLDLPGWQLMQYWKQVKGQSTWTPTLNAARITALINFAIELSYGNPGETKRWKIDTKPESNRNTGILGFECWMLIRYSKKMYYFSRAAFKSSQ